MALSGTESNVPRPTTMAPAHIELYKDSNSETWLEQTRVRKMMIFINSLTLYDLIMAPKANEDDILFW